MSDHANDRRAGAEACPNCGRVGARLASGPCPRCVLALGLSDTDCADPMTAEAPQFDGWQRLRGSRVGRYELLEEIARGGMGIVYRARQLQPVRVVALKMMLPYLSSSDGLRRRFQIESDAIAGLDHAGILPVYEVGETGGIPWFSMKFAEGGSLATRLQDLHGDWRRIATIVATIAAAVQHAHERGVLHRDLKPGNILFDARDEPMIADFGLAKYRAVDQSLTLPTAVLGSPHYIAPEQLSASFGPIGPATDVYSLGAILYELLTGRPPIGAEDPAATIRLVTSEAPLPAKRIDPGIPRGLDAIARKCLEKRPERRYASAAALADDLGRWLAARAVRAAAPQRDRVRWLAAAGAVLAAGAALGVILYGERGRETLPLSTAPKSLAVLRFVDDSAAGDQAYLSDGLSTELIDVLGRSASLRLSAREAAFRLGTTADSLATAARLLGVEYVLGGHTERRGERLRVTAELLRGADGARVWSAAYERPLGELFNVRNLIARDVRGALGIVATPADVAPKVPTRDLEAYRLYIIAQTSFATGAPSADVRDRMIRSLRKATELDPSFAPAWALLSTWLATHAGYHSIDPAQGYAEARRAAERAITLDPGVGDGYRALAQLHLLDDRDLDAAKVAIAKALALQPDDPWTLRVAAHLESMLGHRDAAIRYGERSVARDPLDPYAAFNLGGWYMLAGRDAEAIVEFRRALQLNPGLSLVHRVIGEIHLSAGQAAAALDEFERLDGPDRPWGRALVYAAQGRRRESDAALAQMQRRFEVDQGAWAYDIASIYAYRGEATQAMAWLERASARHEAIVADTNVDRFFRPIANDPRFLEFLKRLQLQPAAPVAN